MEIKKSAIPADSLVRKYLPADYSDVFACEADPANGAGAADEKGFRRGISPDDVMIAFWTGGPAWVGALFRLRNFLVRFVGLKGSKKDDPGEFGKFIRGGVGNARGFMTVAAKNDRDTVLLLTDTHLEAYMSVYLWDATSGEAATRKTVSIITLVRFKNRLGRVYFFVIRPFHALVVKSMLRRAVNQVVNSNTER